MADEAEEPSRGDEWAPVSLGLVDGELQVTPNRAMLVDPDTVFPVFIDPPISIDRAERLMLRSDGVRNWQFNQDEGEGMGRCPVSYIPTACTGNYTKRLFFEFPRGRLQPGMEVIKAQFSALEVHAATCSRTNVDLKQTGAISSSSKWPGPTVIRHLDTISAAYGRADCPAKRVEFASTGLTDAAQRLTNGSLSRLTLALRAGDESNQLAWKRFRDDAVLTTWAALRPAVPTDVAVVTGGPNGPECRAKPENPAVVEDTTPSFQAVVRTQLESRDFQVGFGELRAEFELRSENLNNGDVTNPLGVPTRVRPTQGWDTYRTMQSLTLPASEALDTATRFRYSFRVRTLSHYDWENVGSDELKSNWSSWCYFVIDEDPPAAPRVSWWSPDANPPLYSWSLPGQDPVWSGGPGEAGELLLELGQDNNPNFAGFHTEVTGGPSELVTSWFNRRRITPLGYGAYTVKVASVDSLGRPSTWTERQFFVAAPSDSDAYWHVTAADSTEVADSTPEGEIGSLTLQGGAGIGAAGTGRRGTETDAHGLPVDRSLWFDGDGGQAVTEGPGFDTSKSFSLSSWVMLTDTATDHTVLSQMNAAGTTGIDLRFNESAAGGAGAWAARWTYPGASGPEVQQATAASLAVPNVWTHLAVSYDQGSKELTLFVNGRAVDATTLAGAGVPRAVDGPFVVGHGGSATPSGSPGDAFSGYVDEVRIWHREALEMEVFKDATVGPESANPYLSLLGSWGVGGSTTALPDQSAFGREPMTLTGAATVDVANSVVHLNGTSAGVSMTGPVVDETAPFTVGVDLDADATAIRNSARTDFRVLGQRGSVHDGQSSWALWFHRASAVGQPVEGYWSFGRWSAPGSSEAPVGVQYSSTHPTFELDGPIRLNAVYGPADPGNPLANDMELAIYAGSTFIDAVSYLAPSQGSGALAAGMGWLPTDDWGDWFPGDLRRIMIWAGAATDTQLLDLNPEAD